MSQAQRLVRLEHARLHPNVVTERRLKVPIDIHQHIHRSASVAPIAFSTSANQCIEARLDRQLIEIGTELAPQPWLVDERQLLCAFLQEEIERVDRDQVSDQIHNDGQL